ncbi:MAG: hypothetical protein HZA04_05040 [Nitrospinae bacterium]|nr:hypothetical protein [Nitrospinota bacterium]
MEQNVVFLSSCGSDSPAGNSLFNFLKRERLVCPFAVEADSYSSARHVPIATYCWFMAERHRNSLVYDAKFQIIASCAQSGTYDRCSVFCSVQEV